MYFYPSQANEELLCFLNLNSPNFMNCCCMCLISTVIFDLDLMQLSNHYNFINSNCTSMDVTVLLARTWTRLVPSVWPVTVLEMNVLPWEHFENSEGCARNSCLIFRCHYLVSSLQCRQCTLALFSISLC